MTTVYEVAGAVDPGALSMLDDEAVVAKHEDQLLLLQPATDGESE